MPLDRREFATRTAVIARIASSWTHEGVVMATELDSEVRLDVAKRFCEEIQYHLNQIAAHSAESK